MPAAQLRFQGLCPKEVERCIMAIIADDMTTGVRPALRAYNANTDAGLLSLYEAKTVPTISLADYATRCAPIVCAHSSLTTNPRLACVSDAVAEDGSCMELAVACMLVMRFRGPITLESAHRVLLVATFVACQLLHDTELPTNAVIYEKLPRLMSMNNSCIHAVSILGGISQFELGVLQVIALFVSTLTDDADLFLCSCGFFDSRRAVSG